MNAPPMATTTSPRLAIAAHVRACYSEGQVILLDLRRNRYHGVGGRHLPALASTVDGWPAGRAADSAPAEPAGTGAPAAALLALGLLTSQGGTCPPATFIEEPEASLNAEDAISGSSVAARRWYRFLRGASGAAISLRWRSMLSITNSVAARRARFGKPIDPGSLEPLRNSVADYERLRPLVFTAHDRCLQDSLALVHFLAQEGFFPNWVIGVKTRPFGAHAWVQSGGLVLNDQHEHVRQFCPIVVV